MYLLYMPKTLIYLFIFRAAPEAYEDSYARGLGKKSMVSLNGTYC